MLKKLVCLLSIILCGFVFLPRNGSVSASISISNTTANSYTSGESFLDGENSTLTIDEFADNELFSVTGTGTKLHIKNMTIVTNVTIGTVFYVGSGATLILENVTINASVISSVGIDNYGVVSLDNVSFSSGVLKHIVNNSDSENSLQLHSVNIKNIQLNNGYISVYKDTAIQSPIEISMSEDFDINFSIGKKLVSGVDTKGEFFLNDFYLKSVPNKKSYIVDNNFLVDEFIADITDNYYIDYVGDVGSGITSSYGDTLHTGDIIITKYIIHYTNNNERIYVAGKYCTANYFLQREDWLVSLTTKYYTNGSLVSDVITLDNFTALIGYDGSVPGGGSLVSANDNPGVLDVTIDVKDNKSKETLSTVSTTALVGAAKAFNIELTKPYKSYTINDSNIIVNSVNDYGKYLQLNLSVGSDCSDFIVTVYVGEESLPEEKEHSLYLEEDSFEYTGEDLSTNIKLYYIVDGNKIYLKSDDYKITKNGNISLLINSGNYVLDVINIPAGVTFAVTTFNLSVTKKSVSLYLEGDYTYSGSNQKNDIKIYYIDDNKVYLSASDFIVKQNNIECEFKNAGDYKLEVTTVLDNYNFTSSILDINMNKKIIDTATCAKFLDKTVKYDGSAHSIIITGVDENLVRVEYSKNSFINAAVSPYEITATLTLIDTLNYRLTQSIFVAYLTIQKIDVDMSGVNFDNVVTEYTGDGVIVEISGTLPSFVSVDYEYYLNDTLLNTYPVNAGVYRVVAKFTTDIANFFNYNDIPDMERIVTINSKSIDCSVIKFIDKEVPFDNQSHTITAENIPTHVVATYTYFSNDNLFVGEKNIGSYKVKLNIHCDSDNYTIVNYEMLVATLTITLGDIDMSGVRFDDVEFVYDGKSHSPELIGTLPNYVKVSIIYQGGTQVGEYVAYANFTSTNSNYKNPDTMSCMVVITPKPITIYYDNNYMQGINKFIELKFDGILNEDKVQAKVTYEKSIEEDRTMMTLSVTLLNSVNYYIEEKSSSQTFVISSRSEIFDEITASVTEVVSKDNNSMKITENNTLEINNAVNNLKLHIKNYEVLNVAGKDYNGVITINLNDFNDKLNLKYLKVYSLIDGELVEVDYIIENDMLTINCNEDMSLVFVKLDNHLVRNILLMIIFIVLSLSIVAVLIVLTTKYKKYLD